MVSSAGSASVDVDGFLVTNAASRTALAAQVATLDDGAFVGGSTDFAAVFVVMTTALTHGTGVNPGGALASYVNFATDGVPNDNAAGIAARNALIAAGIFNISIEGIGGGVNAASLRGSYSYPGPCDATAPYALPLPGLLHRCGRAAAYAAAIGNKIQIVTEQSVPAPATLALLGASLIGLGAARRHLWSLSVQS